MTQTQSLRRLKRIQWRTLDRLLKHAYHDGFEAGLARAHGAGRRGRTIRADATVEGLLRRVENHFGLKRYDFEVRVVHPASGRRIPARDQLLKHLVPE
jgi:hypothetical protein